MKMKAYIVSSFFFLTFRLKLTLCWQDSSQARGKKHLTSMHPEQQPISLRRVVDEDEKMRVYEMAVAAQTKRSFILVMHPTYLSCYAPIPSDWANEYLADDILDIELRCKENTWPAKCVYDPSCGRRTLQRRLSRGWPKFVKENYLKSFDVCLFDLAGGTYDDLMVLEVQIFRVKEAILPSSTTKATLRSDSTTQGGKRGSDSTQTIQTKSSLRMVTKEQKKKAYQMAEAASTETSFLLVIQPSYINNKTSYAPIPCAWAKKYLPPYKSQEVELRINGKKWLARCRCKRIDNFLRRKLVKGWMDFVVDNSIKLFDVCLFDLAEGTTYDTLILDVQIFRVGKANGTDAAAAARIDDKDA